MPLNLYYKGYDSEDELVKEVIVQVEDGTPVPLPEDDQHYLMVEKIFSSPRDDGQVITQWEYSHSEYIEPEIEYDYGDQDTGY